MFIFPLVFLLYACKQKDMEGIKIITDVRMRSKRFDQNKKS